MSDNAPKLPATFAEWLAAHRAELEAKIAANDLWMKSEFPHYQVSCGGQPTADGFVAYLEAQTASDPAARKRWNDACIWQGFLWAYDSDAAVIGDQIVELMTTDEMLQRLNKKDDEPTP